jgi:DNA-binding response OmpR family regulator
MEQDALPHVLVVDDELSLGALLKENLRLSGFSVKLCKDGEEGWIAFDKERFDICILDVNMPKRNGYELAEIIRKKDAQTPIIFLTANTDEEDKLKGFEIGADEYITKPFSTNELVARMKAILKRTKGINTSSLAKEEVFIIGNTKIDTSNHLVLVNNEVEKKISSTESNLLKLFIENKNMLLSRNAILLSIWGRDDFYTARNLDVYINKLRKIIKDDICLEITNIHGSGFKLVENSPA